MKSKITILSSIFLLLSSLQASYAQIDSLNWSTEEAINKNLTTKDIKRPEHELFVEDRFYNDVTKVVGNTPTSAIVSANTAYLVLPE